MLKWVDLTLHVWCTNLQNNALDSQTNDDEWALNIILGVDFAINEVEDHGPMFELICEWCNRYHPRVGEGWAD